MTQEMTREQFDALKVRINKDTNIDTSSDSFQGSMDGVTLAISYVEPIVTATIVKKPFFIKESYIEQKIQSYLAGE